MLLLVFLDRYLIFGLNDEQYSSLLEENQPEPKAKRLSFLREIVAYIIITCISAYAMLKHDQ